MNIKVVDMNLPLKCSQTYYESPITVFIVNKICHILHRQTDRRRLLITAVGNPVNDLAPCLVYSLCTLRTKYAIAL